ncbi:hypothetical protein STEG23_029998, partial [Scotinomys teguina]
LGTHVSYCGISAPGDYTGNSRAYKNTSEHDNEEVCLTPQFHIHGLYTCPLRDSLVNLSRLNKLVFLRLAGGSCSLARLTFESVH